MALHFFAKLKIMVVKDIERDEIDFVCKTLGCRPIASLDHFTADALGSASMAEEITVSGAGKYVKITGIDKEKRGKTITVMVRGSNRLMLDEAERSLHDALCVVRCLVKKKYLIPGGGAHEIELAIQLNRYSQTLTGAKQSCVKAYADALEVIPSVLAENCGLKAIEAVTELRNAHSKGQVSAGINVRKGAVSDIMVDNVVQPLLVSTSCIQLASETVRSILKIDDVINTGK